jgi:NADH-quinone oxidoreductase subunit N
MMQWLMGVLSPLLPEVILAIGALFILVVSTIKTVRLDRIVSVATLLFLIGALVALDFVPTISVWFWHGSIYSNLFVVVVKGLLVIGTFLTVCLWCGESSLYASGLFSRSPELASLLLLALVGMLLMVSAGNLLVLYMGLELQSLVFYVLASCHRERITSNEAGLKYFVLGALASGLFLYGTSLVYGYTGTIQFDVLASFFANKDHIPSVGVLLGVVFIIVSLGFKLSAAPFHMWSPDVYHGAPTVVTAFFAVVPKIAVFSILSRMLVMHWQDYAPSWQQVLIAMAILSLVVGSFAALRQDNIKRLLAYSSIGHVGFMLMAIAANNPDSIFALLIYMGLYIPMALVPFVVLMYLRRKDEVMVESIREMAGLAKSHPLLAFMFAVSLFSMAGIPPLAGFFAKFYVLISMMQGDLVWLSVFAVIMSVVSAYYYLRIIKTMYMDDPVCTFAVVQSRVLCSLLVVLTVVTVGFVFIPQYWTTSAAQVAQTLRP